jgi:acetylornithine/N-succinyldiaminopimelate aminotransferase
MEPSGVKTDYFARKDANPKLEIQDAQGSYLIDQNGKKYIDFAMGWCVGNIGWNNEEVEQAIKTFQGPSYVSPHFEYRPWLELAQMLAEITPRNLTKSFRATGGTEAVEIALTAAMEHTGRNKFIGVEGAYHGNSLGARGIVSDVQGLFDWKRIKPPLTEETLHSLEKLLKDKDVAALVMEPVICNLSVHIPSQKFMQEMARICHEHGTLVIMDEVATGFGRTGKMFASEYFEFLPDIMCLAKGITGGAAGLGATIMTEEVARSLEQKRFPFSTYGWHPLGVAAAIANIQYFQKNWNHLSENIRSMSEYFRQRLADIKFEVTPEIQIMGLAISLKFEKQDYAQRLAAQAKDMGLIVSDGILMFPALNIDFETVRSGLDILEEASSALSRSQS